MVHIILLILKIIGIILLCLLGLVLLLVGLVLFVPVRYKAQGSYLDKKPKISGKVTWLFRGISILGIYDGEIPGDEEKGRFRVRIFGITVFDSAKPEKEKEVKTEKRNKKQKSEGKTSGEKVRAKKTEDSAEPAESPAKETVQEKTIEKKLSDDRKKKNEEKIVEHTKKRGMSSKQSGGPKEKNASFGEKLTESLNNFCKKIMALCRQKDRLTEILFSDRNRPAFVFLKRNILKIVRHIFPKKIDGWIHFGMDDPDKTGRMLGRIAVFYPMYAKSLRIAPDFDREIFETKIFFSGRIRAFTLAAAGIKIVLNRDLKRILSELKAVKEENYGRE